MATQRCKALLCGAIAVLAITGTAAWTGPAVSAAPVILPDQLTGTLFIHKHRTPASAEPGNGLVTPVDPQDNPPVEGVVFTVTPLEFDLRTNEGWAELAAMDIQDVADHFAGAAEPLTATDADGLTSDELPVAAYYVVEETGFGPDVTPVAPFVVTLPMTHPINLDEWLYQVHVYPKNDIMDPPVKTVLDAEVYELGDDLDFQIRSQIPDLATGQTLDGYRVRDVLANQLSYRRATAALSTGTPALLDPAHYGVSVIGREVLITFTPDGLALLQANSDQEVVSTVTARVDDIGSILNQATLFPSQGSWNAGTGTGVPSDPVETHWGSITVVKHADGDTEDRLQNAEFMLYASEADALAGVGEISLTTNSNGDGSVWVTDVNGQLTITGLRRTDFVGGEVVPDTHPGYQPYWLVETKAPAGYSLLAAPLRIELTGLTAVVEVADVREGGGFDLPFTGGSGVWLFPIGGALLIGGSALLLVSRRRRHLQRP